MRAIDAAAFAVLAEAVGITTIDTGEPDGLVQRGVQIRRVSRRQTGWLRMKYCVTKQFGCVFELAPLRLRIGATTRLSNHPPARAVAPLVLENMPQLRPMELSDASTLGHKIYVDEVKLEYSNPEFSRFSGEDLALVLSVCRKLTMTAMHCFGSRGRDGTRDRIALEIRPRCGRVITDNLIHVDAAPCALRSPQSPPQSRFIRRRVEIPRLKGKGLSDKVASGKRMYSHDKRRIGR